MRFGSVCSGIEAVSTAWEPLGWEAAWFSEIEPFPCAVLKHRYPHVPNHGDMTTLPARILAGEVEAPDVLVGGTPCQSFSVAGLRKGLDDPRGKLTRAFVEIADAIDAVRAAQGLPPVLVTWENVPGVLSDKKNAFGNFLGALAGEDIVLEPAGGRWTHAGLVLGPTREIAWRVLDAQYFGLAQRRKRVFLVARAGTCGIRPPEVLLVEQGVQRHSAPSREAGQRVAAAPVTGAQGGSEGLGAGHDGGRGVATQADVAGPLDAHYFKGPGSRQGGEREYVAHVVAPPRATFWNGSDLAETLTATSDDQRMPDKGRMQMVVQPMAFVQNSRDEVRLMNGDGSIVGALNAEGGTHQTCYIAAHVVGRSPTAGPQGKEYIDDGSAYCMDARSVPQAVAQPVAFEPRYYTRDNKTGGMPSDVAVLKADAQKMGDSAPHVAIAMQVRRLTPTECERLQGFPDDYTRIPWKGRPSTECPDGPRYKALGNSMAVPVVNWIGRKIEAERVRHEKGEVA